MTILVSRNDKLGDFILSLPVFLALKNHFKNVRLIALVSPLSKELALHFSAIDEVIVDDEKSAISLAKILRDKKIDLAIALFSNFKIALAFFLAGIPRRIAPATKLAQIFYTHKKRQHRSSVKMSEFAYNLDLLSLVDKKIKTGFTRPILHVEGAEEFDNFCKTNRVKNKKIIAFHTGFGGSSIGNLSLKKYAQLGKEAFDNGFSVCFTFGPNEFGQEQTMRDLVSYDAIFYPSKNGLIEFAKIISHFNAFVCTSTGVLHLAGALNIPTFGFFGDTLIASAKRWKSLNDENLQHNYTIFTDEQKQEKQFQKITQDLRDFCKGNL